MGVIAVDNDFLSMEHSTSTINLWIDDDDFKQKFQVMQQAFFKLHDLIKNQHVFCTKQHGPPQVSSMFQLMVFYITWVLMVMTI